MAKKITIIQGHPDPAENRFCHALAEAYAAAAVKAGHEVRRIAVAKVDFPVLRTFDEFYKDPPPAAVLPFQEAIGWAEHVVFIYPMWLGTEPALLKAFFEQTFRPGFAFGEPRSGKMLKQKLLTGKSGRIVVTMGMPAFFYRWFYLVHGCRCQARPILHFCGIGPVRETLFGLMGNLTVARSQKGLAEMARLGSRGL